MPRRIATVVAALLAMHLAGAMQAERRATASTPDAAVAARLADFGGAARHVVDAAGRLTEVSIADGSLLTDDDVARMASLEHLRVLQILDCRMLDDAAAKALTARGTLEVLAITPSSGAGATIDLAHPSGTPARVRFELAPSRPLRVQYYEITLPDNQA